MTGAEINQRIRAIYEFWQGFQDMTDERWEALWDELFELDAPDRVLRAWRAGYQHDEWEGVSREEKSATLMSRMEMVLAECNPKLPIYNPR